MYTVRQFLFGMSSDHPYMDQHYFDVCVFIMTTNFEWEYINSKHFNSNFAHHIHDIAIH